MHRTGGEKVRGSVESVRLTPGRWARDHQANEARNPANMSVTMTGHNDVTRAAEDVAHRRSFDELVVASPQRQKKQNEELIDYDES